MFSQGVLGFYSLLAVVLCYFFGLRVAAHAGQPRALALPTATGSEPPLSLRAALTPKSINSRLKAAYVIFSLLKHKPDLPSWRTHEEDDASGPESSNFQSRRGNNF